MSAAHAEAEAARLAPWLPVCFGIGILFYFAAPQEASFWFSAGTFIVLTLLAFISREKPVAFAVSLAATAAGFSISELRGQLVSHPTLTRPTQTVVLTGFVESRDATDRSDRVVLRLTSASGRGAEHLSKRVRVSLRHGKAPSVGSHVAVKARMRPLLAPTRPGGYDYALGGYFARLGATGFVLGSAKPVPPSVEMPRDIQFFTFIEQAGVVVSTFDIPAACKAPGIDRKMLATTGAVSLRRIDNEWKVETVRSPFADRPWYGRAKPADPDALARFRKAEDVLKTDVRSPLAPAGEGPVPEEEEGEED